MLSTLKMAAERMLTWLPPDLRDMLRMQLLSESATNRLSPSAEGESPDGCAQEVFRPDALLAFRSAPSPLKAVVTPDATLCFQIWCCPARAMYRSTSCSETPFNIRHHHRPLWGTLPAMWTVQWMSDALKRGRVRMGARLSLVTMSCIKW